MIRTRGWKPPSNANKPLPKARAPREAPTPEHRGHKPGEPCMPECDRQRSEAWAAEAKKLSESPEPPFLLRCWSGIECSDAEMCRHTGECKRGVEAMNKELVEGERT